MTVKKGTKWFLMANYDIKKLLWHVLSSSRVIGKLIKKFTWPPAKILRIMFFHHFWVQTSNFRVEMTVKKGTKWFSVANYDINKLLWHVLSPSRDIAKLIKKSPGRQRRFCESSFFTIFGFKNPIFRSKWLSKRVQNGF